MHLLCDLWVQSGFSEGPCICLPHYFIAVSIFVIFHTVGNSICQAAMWSTQPEKSLTEKSEQTMLRGCCKPWNQKSLHQLMGKILFLTELISLLFCGTWTYPDHWTINWLARGETWALQGTALWKTPNCTTRYVSEWTNLRLWKRTALSKHHNVFCSHEQITDYDKYQLNSVQL